MIFKYYAGFKNGSFWYKITFDIVNKAVRNRIMLQSTIPRNEKYIMYVHNLNMYHMIYTKNMHIKELLFDKITIKAILL